MLASRSQQVLEEEGEATEGGGAEEVPLLVLSQIKVKIKKLERFDELWRSAGIATKHKASVWEDARSKPASRKLTQRNRQRLMLGHFCSSSYTAPRAERYALELTDLSITGVKQSKWLPLVVRRTFPHPARFHRVWSIQTGAQPLFVWEPVPADAEHVALGMVASRSEEPPSVRSVHCVPRAWVEPAPELVKMLWSDAGASGKPGSLWAVGSLQLLVAAPGNAAPGDKAWRLKHTRFTLSDHVSGRSDAIGDASLPQRTTGVDSDDDG